MEREEQVRIICERLRTTQSHQNIYYAQSHQKIYYDRHYQEVRHEFTEESYL